MNPTIGRVVVYKPTEKEQQQIAGQGCTPQKEVAAIVVAVNKKSVNLRAFIDGPITPHIKGVEEGKKVGQWSWPVIKKMANN